MADLAYNSGNVPYGARVLDVKRGASTAIGTFKFESISINRPTTLIKRPNHLSAPNGWVATNDFVDGSAVMQISTETGESVQNGDWFVDDFINDASDPVPEKFVIIGIGQAFEMGSYLKANVTLMRDDAYVPA